MITMQTPRRRRTTERETIEAAILGSSSAVDKLFRDHWTEAWKIAWAVSGNRSIADDAAQEAMVRAFESLGSFDQDRPFSAWLHRIVVNRTIDLMRRERRQRREIPIEIELRQARASIEIDQRLWEALERLDADRRVVVILRHVLDFAPSEIADFLDLPEGTVHSRISRALAQLRKDISQDD